jgi:alpha-tubulin suppressor-like RCC1 family protein
MENQIKDNSGAPGVESLVKRGYLFIEDSDWNKADEYFDKALDINPEHAPAYIGKLCVELKARREESLGDFKELKQSGKFDKLLGEYGNFKKALRFADADYLKKLNGYEQKIKENFPKIPQRFTDESIKGELARLEKEIANCDAEIAKGEKDIGDKQYVLRDFQKERGEVVRFWSQKDVSFGHGSDWAKKQLEEDEQYKQYNELITQLNNDLKNMQQRVTEYKGKKAEYETIKRGIEPLAGISCLDRMDVYYNRFVEAMKKESTEEEYKNFAKQFRLLEGYKDSAELADKCDKLADERVKLATKLAIKKQYERLVQEKTEATAEDKYRELSKKFRQMGGYENSAQLADECDKLAEKAEQKRQAKAEQKAIEAKALADNKPKMAKARERIAQYQGCVFAEYRHTVGLKMNGRVVAVGDNRDGQCKVSGWRDIVAVDVGLTHTVGLRENGRVVAVGSSLVTVKDNIGGYKFRDKHRQFEVSAWRDIVAIATKGHWTVGLKADGTVVADGENDMDQCGCDVSGWRDIAAVAVGYDYIVGLKKNGTVVAVGENKHGQCNISAWRNIVAVAVGANWTVGLKADGMVVAVGDNEDGQCNVNGWHDIVAVAVGSLHTVGLKADGTVVAVGKNEDGRCNVNGWRDIVAVAVGSLHTVGLKADGTVVAVGDNEKGQCNVSAWRDIVAVAANSLCTVGLKTDGTVVAVGDNEDGQCNVSDWRDIGPVPKKGVCKYCGGKLGGLFSMKCKSCGKEN